MFFHKASQQAFVFPTKCGTYTVMNFLHNCGWKNVGNNHLPAEWFIEKYPNLQNYEIYAFVRDPVLRFESGILHIKQVSGSKLSLDKFLIDQNIAKNLESASYEDLIPVFSAKLKKFSVIFDPQVKWHQAPNVRALDFNNMEAELRRITGNADQPLVRYNTSTDVGRSVITQNVIDFVRQEYAADYVLAKDRLGKEY
jgi:hypothetical protein